MRRILLISTLLLFAVPFIAQASDVDITVQQSAQFNINGVPHKTITIGYTANPNNIRAFALDINVDNGMNIGDTPLSNFKVGESNAVSPGYGIFPGRFRDFINPSNPNWSDANYNPSTPWAAPGAENTGLGWSRIVVELGTLYKEDANKPATSGTLFSFDVNSENVTPDCNLRIAVEALRGGVVKADGTAATTNLPLSTKVTFQSCTVPNCVGLTRQACIALLGATTPPQSYTDVNTWGAGEPVAQVLSTVPASGADCTGTVQMTVVSYPIKYMTAVNSLYVNWQNRSRPACWAYPRQCNGDADGKKLGNYWISGNDLIILKSGISKLETVLKNVPNGICADFDHKKLGNYWVSGNDLIILKSYISKLETQLNPKWAAGPADNGLCGDTSGGADPNYHYWCLPTGVTTCPPGQICAPTGVCPNTP